MQPKDNARRQIAAFLESHRGQSGIVYCASRKKTEELATHLGLAGYKTLPYHAGMAQQVAAACAEMGHGNPSDNFAAIRKVLNEDLTKVAAQLSPLASKG